MQPFTQRPTRISKHESFTRQVSESCSICQVNQFHCTQCKRSCHKKCPGHNHHGHTTLKNSRSRSYQKIYTGDEHWKKVLQTNDSDLLSCRKHCIFKPLTSPWSDREGYTTGLWADRVKHNYNNKCDLKYFDYANSRENANVCSTSSSVSRASSFASHFRSKSPTTPKHFDQPNSQVFQRSQSRQPSTSSPQKERNVFHALVSRFVNWIGPNKQDMAKQTFPKPDTTDKLSSDLAPTSKLPHVALYQPEDHKFDQRRMRKRPKTMTISMAQKTNTMSTSESEMEAWSPKSNHSLFNNYRWQKSKPRPLSTCSSQFLNTPCISPATSDVYVCPKSGLLSPLNKTDINTNVFNSPKESTLSFSSALSSMKSSSDYEHGARSKGFTSTSTMSTSNPATSSSSSLNSLSSQKSAEPSSSKENKDSRKQLPFKTAEDKRDHFRLKGITNSSLLSKNSVGLSKDTLINSSVEKDSVDISDNISMCSMLDNCGAYLKETLQDCNIPFNDLKLKEVFKRSSVYSIYKGQWHGEVLVYFYNSFTEAMVPKFLQELRRLSRIRHEYIHLFMGASVNTSNIAIVMSELKGVSVYERIHTVPERLPTRNKVNIARHVSQAIGYLHAKGFPVRTINSRNVYFDPKVKLSLLDQSLPCINYHTKSDAAYFSRGALSYLAPELLKEIRPTPIDPETSSTACTNNLAACGKYASISSYGGSFDSWLDDSLFTFKSDTYAFGTFLYEILSYQLPLKSLSNEEFIWQTCNGVRQKVNHLTCSGILKVLIERCWSHNPQQRPSFIEINLELDAKTGLHKRHSSSQPEKLNRHPSIPLRSNSRLM